MSSVRVGLLIAGVLSVEVIGSGVDDAGPPRVMAALSPANAPVQSAFGMLGNGGISVIVPRGNVTYIGGNFNELAAITGAFARLDAVTARRIAPLVEAQYGEVRASAPDGAGGFYIGGTFTQVGSLSRLRIAHVRADGSVDPNFNPGVSGQNSAVNALAVSSDGSLVYVGGGFDVIGGQTRNNLAAVEAATGAVTNFNPAGLGTNGPVFALEVSGTQVYVGGQFEQLGGQVRNGLAKVQATTGGDLGWIPNPTFNAGGGLIFAIEASGDSVYVGGDFTAIGGQPRTHLARLSATSGTAFPGFAPNPNDSVFALALTGSSVCAGGDFSTIAGQSRPTLACVDAIAGALAPFNAHLVATDSVRAIAISGSGLFVGGFLTGIGGQTRTAMAKFDAATGALHAFDASVGDYDATVSVRTLAVNGTSVYVGGDLSFVNRVTRHGIAALDAHGVPTAFNPDAGPGGPNIFNDVSAIAIRDNAIYLGGNFTFNVWVDTLGPPLDNTDVSAVITSTLPIIVERAMYFDVPGQTFGAGHESAGVPRLATEWFLAEGATGPYFDLFVLIANPGSTNAQVEATYLLPSGTTLVKPYTVAANSRFNIWVDYEDARLADTAVSTTIRSTNGVPVIVERSMWWPQGAWYEAHNSPGATTTGTTWALAEGEVDAARGLETYILIANTSTTPAVVNVTVLFEDGTSATQAYPGIPARSRFNVPVGGYFPQATGKRFGAIVESVGATPAQIVVERAMYWDAAGQHWAAGTNALATKLQ